MVPSHPVELERAKNVSNWLGQSLINESVSGRVVGVFNDGWFEGEGGWVGEMFTRMGEESI